METTVKERLIAFIKYRGMNKYNFEKACGFSTGFVANMRVSLQPTKITSIAHNFPELNTGWLLTGEGEMIKAETSPINVDGDLNTMEMEKKIKRLEASIDALIERNERLEAMLAQYKEKESLSKDIA